MSLEDTLSALLEAKLTPLVDANRRLAQQIEQLRRALPTQVVSVAEAARILDLHPNTIRNRIASGEIPSRRVGKSVRVDLTALLVGPSADDVAKGLRQISDPD